MKCYRAPSSLQQKAESSSGLCLCSYFYSLQATGAALEQPNKSVGLVVVAGVKHSPDSN
jgi:hypothetical protein